MAHDPILCQHATFIDVDYPQLISKKVDIIKSTPQLCDFLTDIEKDADSNDIYLKSDQYHALGCDLNNVAKLDSLLARTIDISQCMAICTAEVSITYMDTKAANALIGWAAQYDDSKFKITRFRQSELNIPSSLQLQQCAFASWSNLFQIARNTRLPRT